MSTIKENLEKLFEIKRQIAVSINNAETSISDTDPFYDYPEAISKISTITKGGYLGSHVDEDGIWHKPEEWPDIESLPLPSDKDTVYLLFGNHITGNSFAYVEIQRKSGTLTIDRGHISNGQFIVDSNVTTGGTNYTLSEWLEDKQDDYTIYRIQATECTYIKLPSKDVTINGITMPSTRSTCLMRYGRLSAGNTIFCTNIYIESDNICDLGINLSTNIAFNGVSGYTNCYNLQRVRLPNINLTTRNISATYSMFSNCFSLSDIDPDMFVGKITSIVSNINSMFLGCISLPRINVSNWDTSNITAISSLFQACYNLREIKGLNTWTNLSKATNISAMFRDCYKLKGDLDLENFAISTQCTNVAGIFYNCSKIYSISIKGWNLSNVTSVSVMFQGCVSMMSLNMQNLTPITSTCTNASQLFYNCYALNELILTNWNFSGITAAANIGYLIQICYKLKRLELVNCTFPTTLTGANTAASTVPTYNLPLLRYMDISNINAEAFSGSTGFYTYFLSACNMLEELYPPQHLSKAFSISNIYSLSHDSIVRIFNNLDTVTGTVKLTLGSVLLKKVSDDEKAIATGKGWTLA